MLTPEDQKRIEEEEQYRATVRARIERQERIERERAEQSSRSNWIVWTVCSLIVALLAAAAIITHNRSVSTDPSPSTFTSASTSTPTPGTRYVPVNQTIATGESVVRPGQALWFKFVIPFDATDSQITGNFIVSGGRGNDIRAAITDEINLANWVKGQQPQGFWFTPSPQTAGTINVKLNPGTYYLAFSNRMSLISEKQVFLNVDLHYSKPESY